MKTYAVDVFAKALLSTTVYLKAETQEEAEKAALMLTRADFGSYDWRASEDGMEAEDIDHAVASENEGEDEDPCTIAHAPDGPDCPDCDGSMHTCKTGGEGCWHCDDIHCNGLVTP